MLTRARAAYVIARDEAETLVRERYPPEPIGRQLQPPRLLLFVPPERIARIRSARPVAVRLSAEVLSAECLALTSFETNRV